MRPDLCLTLVLVLAVQLSHCQDLEVGTGGPVTTPILWTTCWIPAHQTQCSAVCGFGSITKTWRCQTVPLDAGKDISSTCLQVANLSSTTGVPTRPCVNGDLTTTTLVCSNSSGCPGCAASIDAGLVWSATHYGSALRLRCPVLEVRRGVVPREEYCSRSCVLSANFSAEWRPADISACSQMPKTLHSLALANLKLRAQLMMKTTSKEIAEGLSNITTEFSKTLSSFDIQTTTEILEMLVGVSFSDLEIDEVYETLLSIVSDMMDADANQLIGSHTYGTTSERLLNIVYVAGRNLLLSVGAQRMIEVPNIAMSLQCLNPATFSGASVNMMTTDLDQAAMPSSDSRARHAVGVRLPANFPLSKNMVVSRDCREHKLQLAIFNNAKLFMTSSSPSSISAGTTGVPANHTVISVRVGTDAVSGLTLPVELSYGDLPELEKEQNFSCAYWNFSRSDGLGGWQHDGMTDEGQAGTGVHRCSSSHLTHFAILIVGAGNGGNDSDELTALSYASLVGCVLSIIGVTATIVTMLLPGLRQNVQGKIIASLCLAILGLLVLFIVAGFASLSGNGCVAAGAFLHYFLLASFGWMLMEGIHLWRLIIHVFSSQSMTDTSLFIMMSSITWGLPLVVVILTLLAARSSYSVSGICFLMRGTALYVAVFTPLVALAVVNWFVFGMVMHRVLVHRNMMNSGRHACADKSSKDPSKKRQNAKKEMKSAVVLAAMLGLTWIFGLGALLNQSLAIQWIFTLLNVLQGFAIFVVQVVLRPQARREWRKALRLEESTGSGAKTMSSSAGSYTTWRGLTALRRQFSLRSNSGDLQNTKRAEAESGCSKGIHRQDSALSQQHEQFQRQQSYLSNGDPSYTVVCEVTTEGHSCAYNVENYTDSSLTKSNHANIASLFTESDV